MTTEVPIEDRLAAEHAGQHPGTPALPDRGHAPPIRPTPKADLFRPAAEREPVADLDPEAPPGFTSPKFVAGYNDAAAGVRKPNMSEEYNRGHAAYETQPARPVEVSINRRNASGPMHADTEDAIAGMAQLIADTPPVVMPRRPVPIPDRAAEVLAAEALHQFERGFLAAKNYGHDLSGREPDAYRRGYAFCGALGLRRGHADAKAEPAPERVVPSERDKARAMEDPYALNCRTTAWVKLAELTLRNAELFGDAGKPVDLGRETSAVYAEMMRSVSRDG